MRLEELIKKFPYGLVEIQNHQGKAKVVSAPGF